MMVTNRLAEFAASIDLNQVPTAAVTVAEIAIMDCLGVALAAANEPISHVLRAYLDEVGGRPVATAIGLGFKTSAELAALAGGAMAHALDYDDVSEPLYGHPSVVLAPAVLAAAQATGAGGRRAVEGYIAGFEVANALGRVINPQHYGLGWHATSTLGALGAAAGVSRVYGLNREQTVSALGIAASLAGGIRRNFGSMTKPMHAGNAARAGVVAASMARHGLTASSQIVEGAYGFAQLFGRPLETVDFQRFDRIGLDWCLINDGIWLKYYPCCASTHRSLDLVSALQREHGFSPARVEQITCHVPAHIPQILLYVRPHTDLEAKFSMQYCLAAALLDGGIGLGSFSQAQVSRTAAQALGERIRMEVAPQAIGEETLVEIALTNGERLSRRVLNPKGHPLNPLSPTEVEQKFIDCASVYPGGRVRAAASILRAGLHRVDRIDDLMADLHGLQEVPA